MFEFLVIEVEQNTVEQNSREFSFPGYARHPAMRTLCARFENHKRLLSFVG